MSIANIIDRRKRPYQFLIVNAIIEAAWHDNRVKDADQVTPTGYGPDYDEREHISLADAITWAGSFESPVTLYVYDKDGGIYVTKKGRLSEERT